MAKIIEIHPTHPQLRLLQQAAAMLRAGAVMVYPTDSSYAIACQIGDAKAVERIRQIRNMDKDHYFTLVCRDLSELATYALVDNPSYRILKAYTPGHYTFILQASREVPKRLLQPKRRTIGLRIPDHPVVQALLKEFDEPLMSISMILPEDNKPLIAAMDIEDAIGKQVDLILDGGICAHEPTSVIDLVDGYPKIIREGLGSVADFL